MADRPGPAEVLRTLSYVVPPGWDGAAVSRFARGYLGFSGRALAGQKYEGGILVNGRPCHANALLRAGDRLEFPLPAEPVQYPAAPGEGAGLAEMGVDVLFEDEDFLVLHKPPGMPVHPSPGHDFDSLLTVLARLPGRRWRVRPLYRLDKDTSGVLPLAKHRVAAGAALDKLYLAVCQGRLTGGGTIDAPIGLAPGSKICRACGAAPGAQRAVTHWQALGHWEGHTLAALRLDTGRTHQIRAHMAYIGHPLAGDGLYGGSRARIARQALHCLTLRLECGALGMERTFRAPVPGDMREAFPPLCQMEKAAELWDYPGMKQ